MAARIAEQSEPDKRTGRRQPARTRDESGLGSAEHVTVEGGNVHYLHERLRAVGLDRG